MVPDPAVVDASDVPILQNLIDDFLLGHWLGCLVSAARSGPKSTSTVVLMARIWEAVRWIVNNGRHV